MTFKEIRIRNGFKTQHDLEIASEIKKACLSKYESGKARPKIDKLEKLADALNITIDELLSCFIKEKN
ncbi:MAG: helix-turn-helix domain-containing protein [Clostridiales bacterium]|jgi:transcriptional regulator with XRE-family HTH domain|nr:helix-turn-helix domain-containing protein [Clostridiales bacterium]